MMNSRSGMDKRLSRSSRLAAWFLTLCLVVSGMIFAGQTTPSYAAAGAKLSTKKVVLQTGKDAKKKTVTIKVKNARKKVKWSTSNKKIAKIANTGGKYRRKAVIKAGSKAGTCYIRAKVGKKTLKCKVIVKKYTKPGNGEGPSENIEVLPLSKDAVERSAAVKYAPSNVAVPAGFGYTAADFSVRLLQQTIAGESAKAAETGAKPGNVLVSPDSVLTALAMTENGAAGETLDEMGAVLHGAGTEGGLSFGDFNQYLSSLHNRLGKSKGLIYSSANSIWFSRGTMDLNKDFIASNKKMHNAETYEASFDENTVKDMNKWVYNNTRNMIKDIIDRLDPFDRVVLINATAFEGNWAEPFEDYQVDKNGKFRSAAGETETCNMLKRSDRMRYIEVNGGKGTALFYQGGTIAFEALLPPEGMSAEEYISGLKGDELVDAWKKASDLRNYKKVRLELPEFKYDYSTSLKDVLYAMGMEKAFTEEADFSGMSADGRKQVMIDDVLHKTHIELDKNGTKAAAATAVIAKDGSAPPQQEETVEIKLDRPFVYALVDTETGIPLFIGTVNSVK